MTCSIPRRGWAPVSRRRIRSRRSCGARRRRGARRTASRPSAQPWRCHIACSQLARNWQIAWLCARPCHVMGLNRPFCVGRPPRGSDRDGSLSRGVSAPHLPWVPEAIPLAEERLCMNVYVLTRVCASRAHGYSGYPSRWSARRAGCSRRSWPTPPSGEDRIRGFDWCSVPGSVSGSDWYSEERSAGNRRILSSQTGSAHRRRVRQ
jgi:hypothetical protein